MLVNEIKSWAKKHGFTVKKKDSGYVWFGENQEAGSPGPIDQVAKEIFNKITDNKFVDYQNNFVPLE